MKRKSTTSASRAPAEAADANDAPVVEIVRAYYHSPIGVLEIAGSERGVASLDFTADGPRKHTTPDCLSECVEQLDQYFQRKRKAFTVKLDLHGTPFQQKVWSELLKIPFGKTLSYLDIALAIGTRKHIRAVGQANGHNPVSIIVPCHRVVGSDGRLTGYGGGLWRKRWLLNFEGNTDQLPLF